MITLRPYQEVPVRKAVDYFNSLGREPSLIVLPTAWGKSILAAYVARSIAKDDRLLVVQPTKELLEQNYGKYISLCGQEAPAGIFSASFGKKDIGKITFATIGSIKNYGKQFRELGFTKMLIDEAHLYPRKEQSMLGGFLKDSGIRQVLGITATPLKLESFSEKQEKHFDKWAELIMLTNPSQDGTFFKEILHVGQISEMTRLGFWTPLLYEPLPFDPKDLRLNAGGGEYSEDSIEEAYKLNNIRANIFGALNYHSERRHCLVFVPSVEEAQILAAEYPGAVALSGETPKAERKDIIERFRKGEIRVLMNVSVLQVGFDYPDIDMILLATSTASVARYYQILGRGVRISENKKDCLVVDMGGNIQRFGYIEDIMFKKGLDRWRMYGTGGQLLTGIPVKCMGYIDRMDINRIYTRVQTPAVIGTGKYKGKTVDEVPVSYKVWALTCQDNLSQNLRDAMIRSLENHVRDTRQDPPMQIMPDGQHSGKLLSEIPSGYLKWYYRTKEWNETNDSLRRGIEMTYNQGFNKNLWTQK